MMKNESPSRRPVIAAALTASILMLVFGVAYRVVAARLAAPVNTTLLSPEALQRFPLQIGDWAGREAPMDEEIVRATDTDAHISRTYSRHNASEHVSLYVAYGVRARDLMPHRPEVCYTGSGWTLIDRGDVDLPLSDGMKLPCNTFQFSRGSLQTEKVVLLNYYLVDGQYSRDVSLLRSKAWRGSGTVGYVAQVQIITSVTQARTARAAGTIVSAFAVESAPPIFELFDSADQSRRLAEAGSDPNLTFGRDGND